MSTDNAFAQQHEPGIGAEIMGAGKFGPPGWQDDADWKGWWGPDPPFHTPTFVLTHRRPRLHRGGARRPHPPGPGAIVLGRGVRPWDGLEALEADYDIEAVSTPSGVTHLTFTRSG